MEELLQFSESEVAALNNLRSEESSFPAECAYTSVIKFHGRPILPPVMTPRLREEMQMYKHQAIVTETRIRAKIRQKLLARVQAVMKDIEERNTPIQKLESPDKPDVPPLDRICESDHSHSEQNVDRNETADKIFPTNCLVADNDNNQSPRTITKDSGLYSDVHTSTASGNTTTTTGNPSTTIENSSTTIGTTSSMNTPEEPEGEEENLDTMAGVRDLSTSEEFSEDETSETTTVEHLQNTLTENSEEREAPLSHRSEDCTTDTEISKGLTQSDETPLHELLVDTESDAQPDISDKVTPQPIDASTPDETRPSDGPSGAPEIVQGDLEETRQPFGSRQRVDHLVKQLDTVLRRHEQNRAMIGQSIPSTSSSATLSSEEMNRTVIAKEDIIQHGSKQQLVTVVGENDSVTDGDTIEAVSDVDAENRSQSKSSEERHIDESSLSSAQLEVSSDSLRASLLSKVVLDTPEATSDDLSEQEGSQIFRSDQGATPVLKQTPVLLADLATQETDVPSPGPTKTPDLSDISQVSDDSKVDFPQDNPISAALKLGGNSALAKMAKKVLMEKKESNDSSPQNATTSSGSPRTDSSGIKSISTTDAFVKSSDVSHLYTASTDLEAYMATSSDTIPSSVTTLPYTRETSGEDTGKQTITPEEKTQSCTKSSGDTTPSEVLQPGTGSGNVHKHIRRSSYTLDQPSPILVAAHAKQKRNGSSPEDTEPHSLSSDKENKAPSQPSNKRTQNFNLTSSMEDLKLKPVHRKLDYEDVTEQLPKPILKKSTRPSPEAMATEPAPSPLIPEAESDTEGKEEHLHRYLEHLSQMPVYHQPNVMPTTQQYSPLQDEITQSPDTFQALPHDPYTGHPAHSAAPQPVLLDPYTRQPVLSAPEQQPVLQDPYTRQSILSAPEQPPVPQDPYTRQSVLSAPEQFGGPSSSQSLNMEEMLQLQMQYFEVMKQQMLQQQQQQLAHMFAEQERQQLMLQQELMQMSHQPPSNVQSSAAVKHKLDEPQRPTRHDVNSAGILPDRANLPSNSETSILYEPYDRPYSVPTPRVSFALGPEDGATRKSPAGVYCNQSFPISPVALDMDSSISAAEESHVSGDLYRSPAVLRQRTVSNNQSYEEQSPQRQQPPQPIKQLYFTHYTSPDADQISHLNQLSHQELPPSLQKKLEKMSAAAKGFLTRKLMKTEKVQLLIKTIRDTAEFALHFQQETPIKKGIYSHQDKNLQERVLAQLTAAMYEIHEIFFEMSTKDRMSVISQSRLLEQERLYKSREASRSRRISAATKKALDRKKKAKAAEAIVFGQPRPKSCPPNTSSPRPSRNIDLRALKPIQAQLSPIKPGQEPASPRRPMGSGLRKPISPRKPATLAVKRMQNKGKPSVLTAGKKTSRKPVVLPSTKKTVKTPTETSPSITSPREMGGSISQQSGRVSKEVKDTNVQPKRNGNLSRPNSGVQVLNQHTKQENVDAKQVIKNGAPGQRSSAVNNQMQPRIGTDSRVTAQNIHSRPNQTNNLRHNELNRLRTAPPSVKQPTSQPPAPRKTTQPKMVRHTSQSKSVV